MIVLFFLFGICLAGFYLVHLIGDCVYLTQKHVFGGEDKTKNCLLFVVQQIILSHMIGFCEFGYRQCESLCDAGCVVWEQRQISVFYFTKKGFVDFLCDTRPSGQRSQGDVFPEAW